MGKKNKNYNATSNSKATASISVDIANKEENSGKSLVQLNAKAVKTGIKNNMTAEMFANEYNCSVEDFYGKLANLFISKTSHDDVMRELKKNENFYKKSTNTAPSKPKKTKETALERAERIIDEIIEQELPRGLEELQKMRDELTEHDAVVVTARKTHEDVKKEFRLKINGIESDIKKYKKALEDKQSELEDAKKAQEKTCELMEKYQVIHKKAEDRLTLIGESIEKALMPTVFIYEDSIDIEEKGEPVSINLESSSDIAKKFMDDNMFNKFRASELKLIAKVLLVARHYNGKIQVTFEDPEIENGYTYALENDSKW